MSPLELVKIARTGALEKKCIDPVVMDLRGKSDICDYQFVCSGDSDRQTKAICESIDVLVKESGVRPVAVEGKQSGQWILMDYGPVIVHVFNASVRSYYALEELWPDVTYVDS